MFGRKKKNAEIIGCRELFGVSALSTTAGIAATFMSTMLMTFLTDYAGLGSMGPGLASGVLVLARLFDAVDDPIQAMIVDNGKVRKYGKYKPFILISIILMTVGVTMLYALPDPVAKNPILTCIWVIAFYLCYDIGTAFGNTTLLFRTMTNDPSQRAKLLTAPRLWILILSIGSASFVSLAVVINEVVENYKTTYFILAAAISVIGFLLSLLGWFMVKERHIIEKTKDDKVRIKDFVQLFKVNKPMVIHFFKNIFSGFISAMLLATPIYYVKWAYCADLSTGKVDMGAFGWYAMIISVISIVSLFLGAIAAGPCLKAAGGSPVRLSRILLLIETILGGGMFILQITGILQEAPILFLGIVFGISLAVGIDFVPQSTVEMEIMDYTIYKTGKDRSALTGVANRFLERAQGALSGGLIGVVLIAIGYNVDSVTGDYVGELSKLPDLLNWFIVICGLLPAILAFIAWGIYRFYPIDDKIRIEIREFICEYSAGEKSQS